MLNYSDGYVDCAVLYQAFSLSWFPLPVLLVLL